MGKKIDIAEETKKLVKEGWSGQLLESAIENMQAYNKGLGAINNSYSIQRNALLKQLAPTPLKENALGNQRRV